MWKKIKFQLGSYVKYSSSPKSEKGTTWMDAICVGLRKCIKRIEVYALKYNVADKHLSRPGRKQGTVSVRMNEFPSTPCLAKKKKPSASL